MSRYGAYANPQPSDDAEMERFLLAGRIKAANNIRDTYAGDARRYASWQATVDRLLEHYANADERAASQSLERVM
jgi:hypothetical protein